MPPYDSNSFAKQISVKSAVNPSLWACVVVSMPLYFLGAYVGGIVSVFLFFVGTIPIASFVISYIYLLFKNPDYLRSEEYQIKAESLKLLGSKDSTLNASAGHVIEVVTNPKSKEEVDPQEYTKPQEKLPQEKI